MESNNSDKLHSKIADRLAAVDIDEYHQWLNSPCSKALLEMLERDQMDLQMSWSLGNFSDEDNHKAQGQSFYILGLVDDIRHMKSREEEVEDA